MFHLTEIHSTAATVEICIAPGLIGTYFDKKFQRQTSHLSLRRSITAACVKLTASVPRPYTSDDLQGF